MAVKRPITNSPKPGWPLPVLLFAVVFATFLPCLRNGFVNLDDPAYVYQNPHVRTGVSWPGFKWAWTNTESSNWHPLTWLSHMLDSQIFGLAPAGHHATNVLLHAANAVLLFLLLQTITGARWRSLIVAALFGLHPLRVESVAWISERKDVLSAFFWLLTMLAYARYVRETKTQNPNSKYFYGLSLLLFALGLLAKSMLVTLPFALLLLDYWPLRRWPQTSVKRLLSEKIPFLLLAAIVSAVTYIAQERGGSMTPADALGLSPRVANALVSYVRYLRMTAWPTGLCAMYPYPGHWHASTVAEASGILIVITAIAVWQLRVMPYLAVGWFWFLGTLIPVIGLVQVGRQALADRYTYIPCIGLFMAVVWTAEKLTARLRNRENVARIAVSAILICCIAVTIRQITFWKNAETLFARAEKVTQRNWIASAYLAYQLQKDGNFPAAAAMYQESLKFNPYRTEVRCKFAGMLLEQKQFESALEQFQKAASLEPKDLESHQGIAATLQDMGRLNEAIDEYNQVLVLKPDDADAYSNLGNCYGIEGRMDDSLRAFEQAVKLQPQSAENHHGLGVALAHENRWDEAVDQFQQAAQLKPLDPQMRHDLDMALQKKNQAQPPSSSP